jgi:hypothetical protein
MGNQHDDDNKNRQTMTTTQQSTWTSVLCFYGRQENDVEWSFMVDDTIAQWYNGLMVQRLDDTMVQCNDTMVHGTMIRWMMAI